MLPWCFGIQQFEYSRILDSIQELEILGHNGLLKH